MPEQLPPPFLTAEWRYLVMLNYEIDPNVLQNFVPKGTELDTWHGRTYVSVVGFMFLNTRLLGIPIPFHTNFEEVNLRFYVRRKAPDGWRRGVVFIKELVPKWAIATTARLVYGENYAALPMRHTIQHTTQNSQTAVHVRYEWFHNNNWQHISLTAHGDPQPLGAESEAEFIAEHYWGYASTRSGRTLEYHVEHPRWRVWAASHFQYNCDIAELYGPTFAPALQASPTSAFLAEGSAVTVRQGQKIPLP